jgi:hypothetical protein
MRETMMSEGESWRTKCEKRKRRMQSEAIQPRASVSDTIPRVIDLAETELCKLALDNMSRPREPMDPQVQILHHDLENPPT